MNFIRFFFREPLFASVVALCLSIVGALLWSDWTEKRKARALSRMRAGNRVTGPAKNGGGWVCWRYAIGVSLLLGIACLFAMLRTNTNGNTELPSASHSQAPSTVVAAATGSTVEASTNNHSNHSVTQQEWESLSSGAQKELRGIPQIPAEEFGRQARRR